MKFLTMDVPRDRCVRAGRENIAQTLSARITSIDGPLLRCLIIGWAGHWLVPGVADTRCILAPSVPSQFVPLVLVKCRRYAPSPSSLVGPPSVFAAAALAAVGSSPSNSSSRSTESRPQETGLPATRLQHRAWTVGTGSDRGRLKDKASSDTASVGSPVAAVAALGAAVLPADVISCCGDPPSRICSRG